MPFRSVRLPPEVPGHLLLDAMPGRFEPWKRFEARAGERQVGIVVCLTPRAEVAELSPQYHRAVDSGLVPFRWLLVDWASPRAASVKTGTIRPI